MAPRVSVIINNYNYAAFLAQAIDSARDQRSVDAEIIVVDDGSTDGSRAVLSGYGAALWPILQPNGGQASAINAGVAASRGEVLCFLDADDWWHPGKLSRILAAFDADPQAVLVYHRLQPSTVAGRSILRPIPRTLCAGDLQSRLLRSAGWWPFPMTSAIAVRRSAWDAAGPIPESLRISADAWLVGIYPFLGRVAALPEVLGYYRIHRNNWYRSEDDAAMLDRRMVHWVQTVAVTNRFLEARGHSGRLQIADHFPYQIAAAQLEGANLAQRFRLAALGLRFRGEPNLPRRVRDALRAVARIRSSAMPGALSERRR